MTQKLIYFERKRQKIDAANPLIFFLTYYHMQVIKRDGTREAIHFDKIVSRITHLCRGTDVNGVRFGPALTTLDPIRLSMSVIAQIKDGISTRELDEYTAESADSLTFENPEYGDLASRILISNHHKNTIDSFSITMKRLYEYKDKRGVSAPLISRDLYKVVERFGKRIDAEIDYLRDYMITFEGFKTLERSYLIKYQSGDRVQERPQHMWMRKALGIFGPCSTAMIDSPYKPDIEEMLSQAFRDYHYISRGFYVYATPTLYNAGTPNAQLSSCFLAGIPDDLKGIYKSLGDCAMISKHAGGLGLHITDIRPAGSYIRGTNGHSNGILPMLRVFNNTAKYVDQCFTGDTLLYTPSGPVPIEKLVEGDLVLTHDGGVQKVEKVLCHTVKSDVYHIDIAKSVDSITVTPEHQVFVLRQSVANPITYSNDELDENAKEKSGENLEIIMTRLNNGYARPEWLDIKDLTKGDYVCFPDLKNGSINDIPELEWDDLRFYGLLIRNIIYSDSGLGIQLKITDNNKHISQFCKNYLAKHGVLVNERIDSDNDRIYLEWTDHPSLDQSSVFTRSMVYNSTDDDNFPISIDKRFFTLPAEKCSAIIRGLVEADDSPALHKMGYKFMEDFRFLAWRSDSYQSNLDCIRWNGMLFLKIKNINLDQFEGNLYDLEVENDHTYITANLGIVHNGGGKRMGSFAMYIEPWHPEIMGFLQAKLPHGHEELRARDLFYGLWICDLFMRRVTLAVEEEEKARKEDRPKKVILWSTFCPHECPGLSDVWGNAFDELYEKYEKEGKARSQIDVMIIWRQILECHKESGACYLLYKDAANSKSNQQNLGTIKSSNLCTEIIEYSDDKEYATCNLASLSLPRYVKLKEGENPNDPNKAYEFDHKTLYEVTYFLTVGLNRVIDVNSYPVIETKISNERHRPIGIGVQGLADVFHIMHLPFDSLEAATLNREIFETIYYSALKASNDLAKRDGSYTTFKGSPASKGILQFDMWNYKPDSGRWDWDGLKKLIVKDGLRNSLLIAPMPTASTSQILGNTECFEPVSYNIFVKRVLAGEFTKVNKHLQRDLIQLGLWTEDIRQRLIKTQGSLQDEKVFSDIPARIRNQYKTAFELKQKVLLDMAAGRGVYVDQSQSLNLFVKNPTDSILTSMHLYGWKLGLKTGMYYLRRETVAKAQAFTIAPRNFSEGVVKEIKEANATDHKVFAGDVDLQSAKIAQAVRGDDDFVCDRNDRGCERCSA